jgi:GNAT superfamily N-acetyltransferase
VGEPGGVTIRAAMLDDVAEMSRVFVDTFRTAHRNQLPEPLLLERTYETSARGWERALRELAACDSPDEGIWVAAADGGAIVGVAMGGPPKPWPADDLARSERPTGECYALYIDVSRQGGGIGRALLAQLGTFLLARGIRRLLVGVLAVNYPARAFYESVGGVLLGGRASEDSGVLLDEVVYVWEDVSQRLTSAG